MLFKKQFLLDTLYDQNDCEIISDTIVDHRRWAVTHELIFKHENKYYRTHYSQGATENQDESPWEFDEGGVVCEEVVPTEKVVTVYVPVV